MATFGVFYTLLVCFALLFFDLYFLIFNFYLYGS